MNFILSNCNAEIFDAPQIISSFIGAFLGFLLGFVSPIIINCFKIRKLKKNLKAELKSIKKTINANKCNPNPRFNLEYPTLIWNAIVVSALVLDIVNNEKLYRSILNAYYAVDELNKLEREVSRTSSKEDIQSLFQKRDKVVELINDTPLIKHRNKNKGQR